MTRIIARLRLPLLLLLASGVLLASCSGLPLPGAGQTPQSPPTSIPTGLPTSPVTAAPGETPTAAGPQPLTVWVPPQFDPGSGTPAGNLLKQRLQQFTDRIPGTQIEVRVKAVEGTGGLFDSLATASAAAPEARPDLIALPQDTLQAAALKGLLLPFDGLTIAMSDPDWYEYARQLANLQTAQFGMPFAGDALLLAYRPSVVTRPPADWAAIGESQRPLLFAASDLRALFPLSQYQSAGGTTSDAQGRPALDEEPLTATLDFLTQGNQAGAFPGWLAELLNPEQAWQAFEENRADQAVAWASQVLAATQMASGDPGQGEAASAGSAVDLSAAPLPTMNGEPLTLATGWVWALGNSRSPNHELATRLAEFLTESSYLASWTQAAGYLPPRPSALQGWENPENGPESTWQELLGPILESARLYPPVEVLTNLGPVLQQATLQVLAGQLNPADAARAAIESLSTP
jgi:maltose-binding protein MalE